MRFAGCDLRDAGCGMRLGGCGMRDAGCGMRDAGCGMRDAGAEGLLCRVRASAGCLRGRPNAWWARDCGPSPCTGNRPARPQALLAEPRGVREVSGALWNQGEAVLG